MVQFYYRWEDRGSLTGGRCRYSLAVWTRVDGVTEFLGHFPVPSRPKSTRSRWDEVLKKLRARRKR